MSVYWYWTVLLEMPLLHREEGVRPQAGSDELLYTLHLEVINKGGFNVVY